MINIYIHIWTTKKKERRKRNKKKSIKRNNPIKTNYLLKKKKRKIMSGDQLRFDGRVCIVTGVSIYII